MNENYDEGGARQSINILNPTTYSRFTTTSLISNKLGQHQSQAVTNQ